MESKSDNVPPAIQHATGIEATVMKMFTGRLNWTNALSFLKFIDQPNMNFCRAECIAFSECNADAD